MRGALDHVEHAAHHLGQVVVGRREHPAHAQRLEPRDVGLGHDAADHHRDVAAAAGAQPVDHLRDPPRRRWSGRRGRACRPPAAAPGRGRLRTPRPGPQRRGLGRRQLERLALDAGDRAVLAEHLAQRVGPLAGGHPRQRARDRRLHQVVAALGRRGQVGQGRGHPRRIAAGLGRRQRGERVVERRLLGRQPAAVVAAGEAARAGRRSTR
jgi:hypothetical protein